MTNLQQLVFAVNHFSMGLLIPVFNLILLEKGATLQTLPLVLSLYAITVLCFEIPSGICADIFGRKKVFLLSCVFQFICFTLLLLAHDVVWLVFAIIFFGLGRAFSSGSLDALIIDQTIARHGESFLSRVTARMAIIEGIALAVGGIAGGIVASTTGDYSINMILRILFTIVLFMISLMILKEEKTHNKRERISLITHLKEGKELVFSTSNFLLLFIGIFFVGFILSAIETYWQPAFLNITVKQNVLWLLGFITFFGFLGVTFGNIVAEKLLQKFRNNWWNIYNICRLILGLSIVTFAFQNKIPSFILGFILIYFFLGTNNVVENTLINKMTPNKMRASILSLNSFMLQCGALGGSIISSILVQEIKITGIWVVSGLLIGGFSILVMIKTRKTSISFLEEEA